MKFSSVLAATSLAVLTTAAPASAAEVPIKPIPTEPNDGAGVSGLDRRHFYINHDPIAEERKKICGENNLNEDELKVAVAEAILSVNKEFVALYSELDERGISPYAYYCGGDLAPASRARVQNNKEIQDKVSAFEEHLDEFDLKAHQFFCYS